ncbi:hypothetical protein PGT21_015938 [Puccinia graminis f. sp. tritici]|uniref:Nucleosome assembly protein n=1 Tax=Puccinia graminis f. sp. tritici TaxID=56615 RepID=A0A5B0N8G7_PUCGR|nr:hypothetical protein PGT21_015938 [Puccinia graminis f. sp. tritici]KAA1093294.1 hypothetical protein PGTUg99_013978 [Puccinia graminis f. sp. tritici]
MSATSAPEKTDGDHVEMVAFDPTLERETQLKEAYGQAQFDEVLKLDEELLKAEWEAYNHKVKLLEPIYKKRSEFIKKIPGFWLKAMTNDPNCNHFIDAIDRDALSHLEDFTLEHDPKDARNVTFHFHFAKGNPYFSDRILTKKFTVDLEDESVAVNGSDHKPNPILVEMNKKYDLDRQVKSTPVPIQWTSDEHNLVAKKPSMSIEEFEKEEVQIDFNDTAGSFFNFFGHEEDMYELHTNLLEIHSKALDLYAGVVEAGNHELAYSDEEEDEEDDDPNQVVDLESESNDEPKKKKAKVSA